MARKTKIVATLGPASDSLEGICALIGASANVLRVNTSHLEPAQAQTLYRRIRQAREQTQRNVGLLVDLQGPKLRLGSWEGSGTQLRVGQQLLLAEIGQGAPGAIPVAVEGFSELAQPGQLLVLGDGSPALRVIGHGPEGVQVEVTEAGQLRPRLGITLPGGGQDLEALTEADREHLQVAAPWADFVALSFVQQVADVQQLRAELQALRSPARLVAKIERAAALEDLEGLAAAADALMVARGDLGVELGLAHVPFAQTDILQSCKQHLTASITATQVLESMTQAATPTRAEVTDIARAVAEGTSAVMLSAETSIGQHPELVVSTLAQLLETVEGRRGRAAHALQRHGDTRAALVRAADELAEDTGARTLLIPTETGQTARYAAAMARQDVVALVGSSQVRRQLALEYAVQTLPWDGDHGPSLPATVCERAREEGLVQGGQPVIVCWGQYEAPQAHLIASLVVPPARENPGPSPEPKVQ